MPLVALFLVFKMKSATTEPVRPIAAHPASRERHRSPSSPLVSGEEEAVYLATALHVTPLQAPDIQLLVPRGHFGCLGRPRGFLGTGNEPELKKGRFGGADLTLADTPGAGLMGINGEECQSPNPSKAQPPESPFLGFLWYP